MEGQGGIGVAQSGDPGGGGPVHQVPRPEARQASQPRAGRDPDGLAGRGGHLREQGLEGQARRGHGRPGDDRRDGLRQEELAGDRLPQGARVDEVEVGIGHRRMEVDHDRVVGGPRERGRLVGRQLHGRAERDPRYGHIGDPGTEGAEEGLLGGRSHGIDGDGQVPGGPRGDEQGDGCVPERDGPVDRPASVVTATRLMLGRRVLLSSGVTAITNRGTARSNVIDSD